MWLWHSDEEIALFSNERYATYIFENELIPYVRKDGSNTYNQLHFYDLPWPVELLEQMGAEKVKIRITLSYYVRPLLVMPVEEINIVILQQLCILI